MNEHFADIRHSSRLMEVQAAFASDYPAYQYRFVEFFIEHIVDVSRQFSGDLQAATILALIGQVHMRAARVAVETGQDPSSIPLERRSTTASRIADVTVIPRETVRRKLVLLEGKGWILRNPNGSWQMATNEGQVTARGDLSDVDGRSIARVARLFRDLEKVVAAHALSGGGMFAQEVGVVAPRPDSREALA